MNWKQWGVGALNAGVSGSASAFLGAAAGLTVKQIAIVAGGGALVSFFKWVIQHPLPGTPTS